MQYEWDEVKRESNLRKYGLDFFAARCVYESLEKVTLRPGNRDALSTEAMQEPVHRTQKQLCELAARKQDSSAEVERYKSMRMCPDR